MSTVLACRDHSFSMGHCVTGHLKETVDDDGNIISNNLVKGKCYNMHGHNYKFMFGVAPKTIGELDDVGRVIDFGVIKAILCEWLEQNWDHKFMVYKEDPRLEQLKAIHESGLIIEEFNPTAENIGLHFINVVAPLLLLNTDVMLKKLTIYETDKCSVVVEV